MISLSKSLAGVAAALLLLAGCDSILDTAPPDALSDDTFWQNADDATRAINGAYDQLPAQWLYSSMVHREVLTPNAHSHYAHEGYLEAELGQHTASSGGIVNGIWYYAYGGVGRANTVLAHLEDIPLDPALKDRIEGEALFLRALYYHHVADVYGRGPLYLDQPSLEQGDLPTATHEELVSQILADLDAAAAKLSVAAAQPGRATRGAALALKARVLLYESRWPEAAQAAQAVMNLGVYSLFPDYRGLFLEENENNSEVIFDVEFSFDALQTHDYDRRLSPDSPGAPGYASIVVLPDLANDYYMKDGLPISESPLYDPDQPFANRDPRFEQTILHEGSLFRGQVIGTDFNPAYNYTGYWFKKYTSYRDVETPAIGGDQSDINLIALRYADVLMMYAEAQNEASGPDGSVYAALDQVRGRAGMPPVTPGLSQAQMRDVIRHERRIEFAGEGLYWSDIRRWRIAEQVIPAVQYETRVFRAPRDYLFPIPQHEIDLNPNLEQNPGY